MSIGVETQLILNWPKVDFAALPVSLLLSVVRFSGTLTIELINPPESSTTSTIPLDRYVAISSYSDFTLDFTVRSLLGSRTKLEDVPKLTDLITSKLRNVYMDRLVYPNFVKIKIPNMWEARDRKTREQRQALDDKLTTAPASGLTASAKERMEEFVEDIKEAWVLLKLYHRAFFTVILKKYNYIEINLLAYAILLRMLNNHTIWADEIGQGKRRGQFVMSEF